LKTVAFVCEKGGVGKTALADEMRYHFERLGIPVSLYSLDGQYGKRGKVVDDSEVAVVDTAGSLGEDFSRIVEAADVVVIPVRPSFADVEPFVRTVELVRDSSDAQVVIAVNAITPYTMTGKFLSWLTSQGWGYPVVTIPHSEAFVQVICTGDSVVGHDRYGKVSTAVVGLCNMVSGLLGLARE
jgi:chromosome partitioning protein